MFARYLQVVSDTDERKFAQKQATGFLFITTCQIVRFLYLLTGTYTSMAKHPDRHTNTNVKQLW